MNIRWIHTDRSARCDLRGGHPCRITPLAPNASALSCPIGPTKAMRHRDVGRGGVEPPRVAPLAPKASASASSAIYPTGLQAAAGGIVVRPLLGRPVLPQARGMHFRDASASSNPPRPAGAGRSVCPWPGFHRPGGECEKCPITEHFGEILPIGHLNIRTEAAKSKAPFTMISGFSSEAR